jgi:hypothetical protein
VWCAIRNDPFGSATDSLISATRALAGSGSSTTRSTPEASASTSVSTVLASTFANQLALATLILIAIHALGRRAIHRDTEPRDLDGEQRGLRDDEPTSNIA